MESSDRQGRVMRWPWLALPAALAAMAPFWSEGLRLAAQPPLLLANAWPWLLLWCSLLLLTRRPWSAALWVNLAAFGVHAINTLKLRQLGVPLIPADIAALPDLAHDYSLFAHYLHGTPSPLWLSVPLLLWLGWHERPRLGLRGVPRLALALLVAGLWASLAVHGQPWRAIYDHDRLPVSFWHPAAAAREYGLTALFLSLLENNRTGLPPPDPAALAEFTAHFPKPAVAADDARSRSRAPDVIVVQSESFFDVGDLAGLDAERFIPVFRALARRHRSGHLRVPTFGGLTTRTEFEFLTGYPLRASPQIEYPYQGLVNKAMPALPWTFKNQGYLTSALHPYDRRFYRRNVVYPRLGFDIFHGMSEFSVADYHGYYISDEAMRRRIVELMDEGDNPQFLFAVSVENHGPWDEGRPLREDELPQLSGPAGAGAGAAAIDPLRRYLHHIRRADAMLGRLADWVLARSRPTVLLFYGDHLPNLPETYAAWPFADGRAPDAHAVPWLMIDNRGDTPQRIDLDASQLAALLLAQVGISDPLFDVVERLREAGTEIDDAQRLTWQRSLAAQCLQQTPAATAVEMVQATIAEPLQWGPHSAEQDPQRPDGLPVWVHFAHLPDRSDYLTIDGRRLRTDVRANGVINATLELDLADGLLAQPGRHDLQLVDPLGRRVQTIGSFTVRPRARRLGSWFGVGGGPFCAVQTWGPKKTPRSPPANAQPDGSFGLWVRAGCMPRNARIVLAGHALQTTVVDNLATALARPDWLEPGGELRVELAAGQDRLRVGTMKVVQQPEKRTGPFRGHGS